MYGFYNQILVVDLDSKTYSTQSLSDELLRKTLGGKGLATHLLLENNPENVDPLSPENRLIIACGPASGTGIWGSSRHGIFTKSPLTGLYSESYSGGKTAEIISKTGYDAIMIHGASDKPVWIEVSDTELIFHSAEELWGMNTYETEDEIKLRIKNNRTEVKKTGVLCIGPAGENLVRFAVVENDYWRSAGRTGVGAVMGSKRIKAIAFHGQKNKDIADNDLLKKFIKDLAQDSKDDPGVQAYKKLGTPMMVDIMNSAGSFPTRYWHKGQADHVEKINAPALHNQLDVKPYACSRCFIACSRLSTVKQGRHEGLKIEGPEYETLYAFGGLCEVDSVEEIAFLNDICDRLGVDTITAGNLAGFTIEASKQGIIDLDIDYGQVDKIAGLIEDIAYRKGIGDLLAEGIKTAGKEWGMEDQAIHVKGMEPAGYDPRILKGMGLAYGTSDRGACHLRATFYKPELAGMVDPEEIEGKAEEFIKWEDRLTFFDAMIFCRFYRDLYQWEQLNTILKGITGLELPEDELIRIAKNIKDNCRRFNLREGLTIDDDRLPPRFTSEALPETGKTITEDQMETLLQDYYKARGWDEKGRPAGG